VRALAEKDDSRVADALEQAIGFDTVPTRLRGETS